MATQGFEFAYMLDGSAGSPVVRDFTLGAAAAHVKGDAMLIQADGFADAVTGSTTEVTGIQQENIAAADVTAGTTTGKIAIVTRNQVWRCSADAATTTAVVGFTKTVDTADKNTIDADDIINGAMTYVSAGDALDSDGNVIMYVVFSDTTFGNA